MASKYSTSCNLIRRMWSNLARVMQHHLIPIECCDNMFFYGAARGAAQMLKQGLGLGCLGWQSLRQQRRSMQDHRNWGFSEKEFGLCCISLNQVQATQVRSEKIPFTVLPTFEGFRNNYSMFVRFTIVNSPNQTKHHCTVQ